MKAYHRVDPLMDERKGHYSPSELGAFLKVQLVAGRQTRRGRFRSLAALKAMLPSAYVKYVDFLVDQGDLVVMPDDTVYVDGWDEWQEGDLTVRERMSRLRERNRNKGVTQTVTGASPTAHANASADVTTEGGAGGGGAEIAAIAWLAAHGCTIRLGNGYHRQLVTAVSNHGVDAVIRQFERLNSAGMKHGDDKGYVFGAIDALNAASRPDLRSLESQERADARSRAADGRIRQQRIRNYRNTGVWDESWGSPPAVEVVA